jgi:hypothetical protein
MFVHKLDQFHVSDTTFNQYEVLFVDNEIVFGVTAKLQQANVPHFISDRYPTTSRVEVFKNEEDYRIAMENVLLPKMVYSVIVSELEKLIDFYHPDHSWVELNSGEWITPDDIKQAIIAGLKGIEQRYDDTVHFKVNRDWHIRRVIHLVANYHDTPIQIIAKEDERGNQIAEPIIGDGKHRFMAAVVRGDTFIGATFNSLLIKEAIVG